MTMDSPVEIREAGMADVPVIVRIIRESFRGQAEIQGILESEYPRYVAFTDEAHVLRSLEKGQCMALLYRGAEPIGGIWHTLDRDDPQLGHVSKLAVLPASRGRGHGELLFAYAEEKLRALGAKRIQLTCNARLTGLHTYYERLGYRKAKQEAWPFLPFEVLTMEKHL
jgi:GNAT superfamily N-acetyltransferase